MLLIVRPRCTSASPLRARRLAGWRRPNVAHGIRRRRRHQLRAHRMLCFDARLAKGKTADSSARDVAIPIRAYGRRRARHARSNMPNTVLPDLADRKPNRDVYKDRLPASHGSDQHRAAASGALLFLEKATADFGTKSGPRGARSGPATARAGSAAQADPTGRPLLARFPTNEAATGSITIFAVTAMAGVGQLDKRAAGDIWPKVFGWVCTRLLMKPNDYACLVAN